MRDETATLHAGCNPKQEKSSRNFWKVYGGIPGAEHRVPFIFSEGFKKGRLDLKQTIALLSANPATFADLAHKGSLADGKDADMTLIDLWTNQIIKAENMFCKGKDTPFENVCFSAVVEATFLRGKLIAKKGEQTAADVAAGGFLAV